MFSGGIEREMHEMINCMKCVKRGTYGNCSNRRILFIPSGNMRKPLVF